MDAEGRPLKCARCLARSNERCRSCPYRAAEPRSLEGRSVLAVVRRPGVWRRAGLDGRVSGLDHAAALALLAPDVPHAVATALLDDAERGLLKGQSSQ